MSGLEQLIDGIASTLASSVKAYNLPSVAASFGLAPGEQGEAFSSKRVYVKNRLYGQSKDKLVEIAKKVQEAHPTDSLQCIIEEFDQTQSLRISPITRQHLFSTLSTLGSISGKLTIVEFMEKLWPIRTMRSSGIDFRCVTVHDEILQHMFLNDDYSFCQMLEHVSLTAMSNRKLVELLELAVHPLVRVDNEQSSFVDAINAHLKHDGLALVATDQMSGYPVFRVSLVVGGVSGIAKNLIFASNGPKPEIVFADAINNDIKIVKNEEYCLVYDLPLTTHGLLWTDLVAWWAEKNKESASVEVERNFYRRLENSFDSPPEKLIFRTYFKLFRSAFGKRLPALIPQVYLHYDPYTIAQLRGVRRIARQRMDFLFLFSSYERIVIEVDGKQHYSDGDIASPAKYAEMVNADRDLRLMGYDVYRFGGSELAETIGEETVSRFISRLFQKHGIHPETKTYSSVEENE